MPIFVRLQADPLGLLLSGGSFDWVLTAACVAGDC